MEAINQARDILSEQPLLRRISGSAIVSGDIHGDIEALNKVIDKREEYGAEYLILLGDYVDRGNQQVEVVERIAELILDDSKFIPLRGNHEDILICSRYGFTRELDQHNMEVEPVMKFFAHLPNAALSEQIFMAHGGIPIAENFKVEQINDFDRDIRIEGDLQSQIHWNDPIYNKDYNNIDKMASARGPGIWQFGSSITDNFFRKNDLSFILRAHIALLEGARYMQENRILSLFTSQGGPYRKYKRKIAHLELNDPDSIEIIDITN